MSFGNNFLHSHSGLERELRFPKNKVLIDARFADKFKKKDLKPFQYKKNDYFMVDTYLFWKMGGVFKNLSQ